MMNWAKKALTCQVDESSLISMYVGIADHGVDLEGVSDHGVDYDEVSGDRID